MGRISDEEIQKVRDATDIVSLAAETVVLRQRGAEFWGCCPFHQEKTPSFKVNPATQLWHCFGCSSGGDVFTYVMRRENLEFPDAVRYLAERAHIELHETTGGGQRTSKKGRLHEVCELTTKFYQTQLLRGKGKGPEEARAYLAKRGFNSDVCKAWDLGYAPGRGSLCTYLTQKGYTAQELLDANVAVKRGGTLTDRFYERIMFPITDEFGKAIAFGGRIIGTGEPKYLNSQETALFHKSKNLYALDKAKETMVATATAIVVEGYTDVIALHEAGLTNVVATLGTALTERHVKLLSRFAKRIVFLFDGDQAGQNAAERALQFLTSSQADFFCVLLPDNLDPADYVGKYGKEKLKALVDKPAPLVRFVIDRRLASYNLSIPEQRIRALADSVEALAVLKGTLLAEDYCNYLADVLGADIQTVKQALARAPKPTPVAPQTPPRMETQSNVYKQPAGVGKVAYNEQVENNQGSNHTNLISISSEDARALKAERELLVLFANFPDKLKQFGEKISQLTWIDPEHEVIAWAMLSTPKGATAQEVVAQAQEASEKAISVLSAGKLVSQSDVTPEQTAEFLLDELTLLSHNRKIRRARAQLKQPDAMTQEDYDALFEEVSQLQMEVIELEEKLRQASKRD